MGQQLHRRWAPRVRTDPRMATIAERIPSLIEPVCAVPRDVGL